MGQKVIIVVSRSPLGPKPWIADELHDSLLMVLFAEAGADAIVLGETPVERMMAGVGTLIHLPPEALPLPSAIGTMLAEPGIRAWRADGPEGTPMAMSFGGRALAVLRDCRHRWPRRPGAALDEIAGHLCREHEMTLSGPEPGLAAAADPAQRARVFLGGKDVTLRRLAPMLSESSVDPGASVSWRDWSTDPDGVRARIKDAYGQDAIIVRSCHDNEDGWNNSLAGVYSSGVVRAGDDPAAAMERVFGSYPSIGPDRRVFVQRWIAHPDAAGVVTSRTLAGAPYYVVAVDELSGRSDQVTSGADAQTSTWYFHRSLLDGDGHREVMGVHRCFVDASTEVERVIGTDSLDLELALTQDGVHLLQARPLVAAAVAELDVQGSARIVERGIRRLRELGDDLLLSNMADWNPAEMIGRRPSPLAASLYQSLITDATWARQRAECGYVDLRGRRLMHLVAGSPYIDVRASLTSLLPSNLSAADIRAVVGAQAEMLKADPAQHDKIEFSIATSCWTPDLESRLGRLAAHAVPEGSLLALRRGVLAVTRKIIADLDRHARALACHSLPALSDAHPDSWERTIRTAEGLALIFAHLARAAFVAVDLLRSLEDLGLIEHREAWIREADTVIVDLRRDAAEVGKGEMSWTSFVERYRWTRPGTYDPAVPPYGERPEEYLRPLTRLTPITAGPRLRPAPLSGDTGALTKALAPVDLDAARAAQVFHRAIRAREAGKAMYAAWVSAAIESAAARVGLHGLDRADLAFLEVGDLGGDGRAWPSLIARRREEAQAQTRLFEPPDFITEPDDLLAFARGPGRTDFVGSTRASGPVHLDPTATRPPPAGSIVVIEAADPGFDWMLALGIGGLVTAYGGMNSHMAIRCAELGLAAAIGVGLQRYEQCRSAHRILVDSAARRLVLS